MLRKHRYVINPEAQKKMYKSMIKNQPVEPRDAYNQCNHNQAIDFD